MQSLRLVHLCALMASLVRALPGRETTVLDGTARRWRITSSTTAGVLRPPGHYVAASTIQVAHPVM